MPGSKKDASRVTKPDTVRRPAVKANVGGKCVRAFQDAASLSGRRCVVNDQLDALILREIPDDLGIDPRNRLKFSWPVSVIVRPRKPGRDVRLPLSGHAVAKRGRNGS